MSRLTDLETSVRNLYLSKDPKRDEWADWLWEKHVLVAADTASKLAEKHEADKDLSRAAAILHDIADAVMKRREPNHETKSLNMAKELLEKIQFDDERSDARKYYVQIKDMFSR